MNAPTVLPQVPGFRVLRQLGTGGSGAVYHAIEEEGGREVALKLFEPIKQPQGTRPEHIEHECRIARMLRHRNLARLHLSGGQGERRWLAWEYLGGGALDARIRHGLSQAEALQVVRDVARGLGQAHACGVVHGDVKPDNILFRDNGDAVLVDYGVAVAGVSAGAPAVIVQGGTPDYMSPEQRRGSGVDGRSDFYSLGVVLHEMLTGRRPQPGVPLDLPAAAHWLLPLLESLLAENPGDRPADTAQLLELMASLCAASPQALALRQSRRRLWHRSGLGRGIAVLIGLILLLAVLALLFVALRH